MNFAQSARAERAAYFNFHGPDLELEYAAFVVAVERWATKAKSAGAIEFSGTDAAKYANSILDAAKNELAEEVADYLDAGQRS